jgi:hypothetical protein
VRFLYDCHSEPSINNVADMKRDDTHSRLLTNAAKTVLSPLGVVQKGRSRTWLDDHGWWVVVIEFQPSSSSKGSYLNVGAMWLWGEKDYFSFDHGYRVENHAKYAGKAQFEPQALRLANSARDKILEIRMQLRSVGDVARLPLSSNASPWQVFHAAVACGCVGNTAEARRLFQKIARYPAEQEWVQKLQNRAQELETLLANLDEFKQAIMDTIWATRKLLKLPGIVALEF